MNSLLIYGLNFYPRFVHPVDGLVTWSVTWNYLYIPGFSLAYENVSELIMHRFDQTCRMFGRFDGSEKFAYPVCWV